LRLARGVFFLGGGAKPVAKTAGFLTSAARPRYIPTVRGVNTVRTDAVERREEAGKTEAPGIRLGLLRAAERR
jgi:hypothetical protein